MISANPVYLPVDPQRPPTRPVAPVSDGDSRFGDAPQQRPSTYVYRGELLDGARLDKSYRPQLNLQIHPQNQRAINAYHQVQNDPPLTGQILDGFI